MFKNRIPCVFFIQILQFSYFISKTSDRPEGITYELNLIIIGSFYCSKALVRVIVAATLKPRNRFIDNITPINSGSDFISNRKCHTWSTTINEIIHR